MPQVSKYQIEKNLEERMFELFWQTMADLNNKRNSYKFLTELLTYTEQIMLAKRLSVAIMLIKNYDYRTISQILKVSTATVMRINNVLRSKNKGYQTMIDKILKQEKIEGFFDYLNENIKKIIPPRRGLNWSEELSRDWKEIRKRKYKRRIL